LDASKLLDVDVDQLTGPLALVAPRGLKPQATELAHPDPREDARDGRERHAEDLGDLRAREAQSPKRRERLHALLAGAVRDRARRRGAVQQPELALGAIATDPLARTAHADFGGRGRLRQRPSLIDDSPAKLTAPFQTEG